MINLHKLTFNPFQENTYIVWDEITSESIIVDPGCSNKEEEMKLTQFVKSKDLIAKYMINTHCHIDHVIGNSFVKRTFDCEFYCPELDMPMLNNVVKQGEMFGLKIDPSPLPDKYLSEELVLQIGTSKIEFIFTPGHSPGEFCIVLKDENICISGDVLFFEGIGRTDLWGGDYDTLIQSIKHKLFHLDDGYSVFPGHGDHTTIAHEKSNNPFLI